MKLSKALYFKGSLNQGLAEKVEALDRRHYPDSLIEILEAVLLDQTSPRGLPLLMAAINCSGVDAGEEPQAAEVLWQGLLLTAILAAGKKPSDGLAAGLSYRFDTARLLLAADTLLTWPYEISACSGKGQSPVASLASSARQVLTELVSTGEGMSRLLNWNPLPVILTAGCPGKEPLELDGVPELASAFYLADLVRWLGSPSWLAGAVSQANKDAREKELSPRLEEVRNLLIG